MLYKAAASLRYRVWTFTLLGLLALPVLSPMLPHYHLTIYEVGYRPPGGNVRYSAQESGAETLSAVSQSATADAAAQRSAAYLEDFLNESATASEETISSAVIPAQAGIQSEESLVWFPAVAGMTLWLIGTSLLLVHLGISIRSVRKMIARYETVNDPVLDELRREFGIKRAIRLMCGPSLNTDEHTSFSLRPLRLCGESLNRKDAKSAKDVISVPFITGIFRPTIVLPPQAQNWSAAEKRAVLTHELAHVVRGDLFWQLMTQIVCAFYWFHPLVWFAAYRIWVERESACDDTVVLRGEKPSMYADLLLELANGLRRQRIGLLGCTVAMTRKNKVGQRIKAILNPNLRRHPLGRVGTAVFLCVAIAAIVLTATISPFAQTPRETATVSLQSADTVGGFLEATQDTVQITGRFVTESGVSIPNVSILVVREWKHDSMPGTVRNDSRVAGDADGKFSIPAGKRDKVSLLVQHKDFVGKRLIAKKMEDNRDEIQVDTIVLKNGFAGTILVLDKNGKAVDDVWVQLSVVASQEELNTQHDSWFSISDMKYALTNAQGKAIFDHVESGNYIATVVEQPNHWMSNQELEAKPTKGVYEPIGVQLSPTSWSATIQAAKTVNVIVHFSDNQTTPERERRTKIQREGAGVQGIWVGGMGSSHSVHSIFVGKHLGEGHFSFEIPVQLGGAKLVLKEDNVGPWVIDNEISYRCFVDGKEFEPLSYPLHFPLPSLDGVKNIEVKCYKSPKITLHVVDESGNPVEAYFSAALYSKRGYTATFTLDNAEHVQIAYPGSRGGMRIPWAYASIREPLDRLCLDIAFAWRNFGEDTAKVNYEGILPDEELRLYVVAKGYDVAEQVIPKMAEGEERELTVTLKKRMP